MYPNGIAYQSPGLQRSATPGGTSPFDPTPKGLRPMAPATPGSKAPLPPALTQPRWGRMLEMRIPG